MDRLAAMQIFVRVVETGSFSKAAADLSIAQPTVTKSIAALERSLNSRLLNRNTHGVSTTEIGVTYYERSKVVLHELSLTDEMLRSGRNRLQGELRVNTSIALGARVVAPLALRFAQEHPGVRIDLSCDDGYVDLVGRGADLAIRMGQLTDSSYGARRLGFNPWVIVASCEYLRLHGTPEYAADLEGHACLVYSSVHSDDVWRLKMPCGSEVYVRVRGSVRSNNLSTLLMAASSGMGLALLPHYVAAEALATGRVVRVLGDHEPWGQEVHVVYPSPKRLLAKTQLFADALACRFQGEWWLAGIGLGRTSEPRSFIPATNNHYGVQPATECAAGQ